MISTPVIVIIKKPLVCQPQPKSRSKHRAEHKIVSSSSLVWDTKHFWASQQHSAAQEERELNQSMSCGFTLHICVSRLLEYHFGFRQYNPWKNPKMEINQVWPEKVFFFMARKVITKKVGFTLMFVIFGTWVLLPKLPTFSTVDPAVAACLPPLLEQLLIPPPTGGHIPKPSRLA